MSIFYDQFHSRSKTQTKIISKNNFTYRNTIELLEPLLHKKNLNILDYGCGVGTIDFYLASKGHKILGLEVSKIAIQSCRHSAEAMGLNKFTKFESINKKLDSKYDLILCSEVIEHVPNDSGLIKKLSTFLKRGGLILISVPSKNAPLYKLGLADRFDKKVGHLRRYNQEKLIATVNKIGLRVIKTKKVEGILRNSFFVFPTFGTIVKFLKGPLSDFTEKVDSALVGLFGESNIYILAQKP